MLKSRFCRQPPSVGCTCPKGMYSASLGGVARMAILQETPPTPGSTALSSLDQATGMSRSPTPERRRDDALYDAPSPAASPADPALRSLPAKSLLPSRAPLPPRHFPFPRSASSPPFLPIAAQLARFHFFPSAARQFPLLPQLGAAGCPRLAQCAGRTDHKTRIRRRRRLQAEP
jgi:hypothetical protein